MSSIPDSISPEVLQNLMEDAKETAEKELKCEELRNASPEKQLARIVDAVEELSDEWGTIFSYKLIADYAIFKLYQHHNEAFGKHFDESNKEVALCWARDAGHLQVIGNTLRSIWMGPCDFLCTDNDSDEEEGTI